MGKPNSSEEEAIPVIAANVSSLNCIYLSNPQISTSVFLLKQEITKKDIISALKYLKMTLKHKNRFTGQILWPTSDILPGWRQIIEKYHLSVLELGRAISRIIALALDLEVDFFDRPEILGKPIAILRLLHYEARESEPGNGIYGAGAHSDYGLITLLATDNVQGLQMCKDKDAKTSGMGIHTIIKRANFASSIGERSGPIFCKAFRKLWISC